MQNLVGEEANMPTDTKSIAMELAEAFGSPESNQDPAAVAAAEAAAAKAAEERASVPQKDPTTDPEGDPLAGVTVDQLFQHPTLGKELQSKADRDARAQIEGEVEKRLSAKQLADQRTEDDEFFGEMTDAELAREIEADKSVATRFARWQESQQRVGQEEVTGQAQVLWIAGMIQSTGQALADAGIADQALEGQPLDPRAFTSKGQAGVIEWQSKVMDAIAEKKAAALIDGDTDERVEAKASERLAEQDRQRPGALSSPGRRANPRPELTKTPTSTLFTDAWKS